MDDFDPSYVVIELHWEVHALEAIHKSDDPVSSTMSNVCAGVPIDTEPEYEVSSL